MKLAVTSQGPELGDPVDPRFGRAKWFVIVDTETGQAIPADNTPNLQAAQGAGIQAACRVSDLGARVVLTGHVGPKAYSTLTAAGIRVCTGAEGTVAEAVDAYQAGVLTPTGSADVEGHWT